MYLIRIGASVHVLDQQWQKYTGVEPSAAR